MTTCECKTCKGLGGIVTDYDIIACPDCSPDIVDEFLDDLYLKENFNNGN